MKYEVVVDSINSLIEEEIDIIINNTKLKCFMAYETAHLPEEGKTYFCEIDCMIVDELSIKEIREPIQQIKYEKTSFSHKIYGRLDIDKGLVSSVIDIYLDMPYLYDYAYLDDKFVEIVIDRFNIRFL